LFLLRAVPHHRGPDYERGFGAIGTCFVFDNLPRIEAVLAPVLENKRHVSRDIVGFVEPGALIIGVENCGAERHVWKGFGYKMNRRVEGKVNRQKIESMAWLLHIEVSKVLIVSAEIL
jgi:hypothetical protein